MPVYGQNGSGFEGVENPLAVVLGAIAEVVMLAQARGGLGEGGKLV